MLHDHSVLGLSNTSMEKHTTNRASDDLDDDACIPLLPATTFKPAFRLPTILYATLRAFIVKKRDTERSVGRSKSETKFQTT